MDTDDEEPKDLEAYQNMELAYLRRGTYKKIVMETIKTLTLLREFDAASVVVDRFNSSIFDLTVRKEQIDAIVKANPDDDVLGVLRPEDIIEDPDFLSYVQSSIESEEDPDVKKLAAKK